MVQLSKDNWVIRMHVTQTSRSPQIIARDLTMDLDITLQRILIQYFWNLYPIHGDQEQPIEFDPLEAAQEILSIRSRKSNKIFPYPNRPSLFYKRSRPHVNENTIRMRQILLTLTVMHGVNCKKKKIICLRGRKFGRSRRNVSGILLIQNFTPA